MSPEEPTRDTGIGSILSLHTKLWLEFATHLRRRKPMDQKTQDLLKQTLISRPSLLSFESELDYRQRADAIRDHISPQDVFEEMWTSEIVEGEWEIFRLRRYKRQIVLLDRLAALRNLLPSILPDAHDAEIDHLARRWFTNKTVRKQIRTLLRSIGLDESAIDAEAYRLSIADFAAIDRRLMELALRRDKIVQQIENRRAGLAVPPGHRHGDQEVLIEHGGRDA